MNEYVRKEDASDAVIKHLQFDYEYAWGVREAINALPSADVVPVVRCENCKYRGSDDFCVGRGFPYQLVAGDEFCSRAKMKEHTND